MVIRLLVRWVVLAVIIGIVANVVDGVTVSGGYTSLLWIALIFSLVNLVLGPVFRLLSFPLIIVTLGLFLLVVNAALLGITAALSSQLAVRGFGPAVFGGLLIAVLSWISELALPARR